MPPCEAGSSAVTSHFFLQSLGGGGGMPGRGRHAACAASICWKNESEWPAMRLPTGHSPLPGQRFPPISGCQIIATRSCGMSRDGIYRCPGPAFQVRALDRVPRYGSGSTAGVTVLGSRTRIIHDTTGVAERNDAVQSTASSEARCSDGEGLSGTDSGFASTADRGGAKEWIRGHRQRHASA